MQTSQPMNSPAVIRTIELTKRYGDLVAVDSVNLNIERGEIFGFLGLNGAGKTTTIRCPLGMIGPTQDAVELFGGPIGAGRGTEGANQQPMD